MSTTARTKIIEDIRRHPKQRVDVFVSLSPQDQMDIFGSLSNVVRRDLLHRMDKERLRQLVSLLDPEDITDLIQLLPSTKADYLLKSMPKTRQQFVSTLLKYNPETAGGIMSLDFVLIDGNDTITDAAKKIQSHEKRTGRLPSVIVQEGKELVGQLHTRGLVFGFPKEKVKKHIKSIKTISVDASANEVLRTFHQTNRDKLIVIDKDHTLVGIIFAEDIIKYAREKESEALYDFAGVSDEETVFDTPKTKVKLRYRWLLLNLGTTFLAASVVGLFEDVIARNVLLAVYMPIVAGMGGNAGTQTLAVLVRGISLGQIDLKHAMPAIRNEVMAGLANGIITGGMVALMVLFLNQNILVALILSVAMIVNLTVSGFFGTLVPLAMKRLGNDPASSATIFITTATDVFGFFVFLGLASLLL